ncbi:hypothetical protein KFE25_004082 [Diacronema lutheri]|uniref:Uncharacterized protein n=2 Tax=Diacronema lutheri TaxID=2081491 RepID=A0A8J6C8P3_DIALT|nr:hypothetical protein KFE25_004082 [Diacronema lutheri]
MEALRGMLRLRRQWAGAVRRLSSAAHVPIVSTLEVPRPGDTARVLASWLEQNPHARVVALLGKADGAPAGAQPAGTVVCSEVSRLLSAHAPNCDRPAAIMMSAGAEGVEWPRLLVFCHNAPPPAALDARAQASPDEGEARLAFACAFTRELAPHELGTLAQVEATRQAVVAACAEARLDPRTDLCLAEVQCPLLSDAQIEAARAAGAPALALTSAESAGLSRGASALGVGSATGEVGRVAPEDVCSALLRLRSDMAAASARPGLSRSEVLVIGNATGSASTLRAARAVMADAADVASVARALGEAGLDASAGRLSANAHERLVCALAKADGAAALDQLPLAGRWTDSDARASQFACARVGGALRRLVGDAGPAGRIYVSGGAEHQGPPGGGPVCIIFSCLLGDAFWRHVREGYFP